MPLQIFTVREVKPQTLGGWSQRVFAPPSHSSLTGLVSATGTGSGLPVQGERRDASGERMSGDHCWFRNWPFFGSLCCFGATMLLPVPIPSWCMWATALLSLPHYKDHIQAQGGWQVITEPAPFCWDWVVWKGLQVLLPTKNWHLPSASTRIKSQDAVTADLQHPWKEFRVDWNEVLCLGQNWQNKSSASYFQEMVLWAQSLRIEKSTKIINADICSSRKQQPSAKCVLDCIYSPFTKITHILTFPHTSLEKFLRALWDAVSQVIVHILPQIKLSSQLSCCAFYCCCWHCPALAGVPEHKGSEWGLGQGQELLFRCYSLA